jgi:hypothetical protein
MRGTGGGAHMALRQQTRAEGAHGSSQSMQETALLNPRELTARALAEHRNVAMRILLSELRRGKT